MGPQEKFGVYVISIIGVSLQKLRDDARFADISPDGSQIVFVDTNSRDLWLMNADGSQSRLFLKSENGYQLFQPVWFANGRRIFYVKYHEENGKSTITIESRNSDASDAVPLLSNKNVRDYRRAPSGRLILEVAEESPNDRDSNLWEIRYNPDTGKPTSPARRLTEWTDFRFSDLSLTADGKTLAFLNSKSLSNVYIGKLSLSRMEPPQGLTFNQRNNWVSGWSADSKTVFFYSDMAGGGFDIYRQSIDSHSPEKLSSGPDDKWTPQASPDGKWVLYMSWPKAVAAGADPPPGKLMRIPASGGPAEFVADLKGHPFAGSSEGGYPSFHCPSTGTDCVLAEQSGDKEITFTRFDPLAGRKKEITKFSGEPEFLNWNLSRDGSYIAISFFDFKTGDISIIPVKGGVTQKTSLLPWQELGPVAWAPDGKSLFVGSYSSRGSSVLRVDPGKAPTLLWKSVWDVDGFAASPDGHYLAIAPNISDANAWIIPNFVAK